MTPSLVNQAWMLSTVWLGARLGALFMFSPIFTTTKVLSSTVSVPMKLLLFVLIDGWNSVAKALLGFIHYPG